MTATLKVCYRGFGARRYAHTLYISLRGLIDFCYTAVSSAHVTEPPLEEGAPIAIICLYSLVSSPGVS